MKDAVRTDTERWNVDPSCSAVRTSWDTVLWQRGMHGCASGNASASVCLVPMSGAAVVAYSQGLRKEEVIE